MNNKLKDLADKANVYTDVSGRWLSAAGMEKFAELIVLKCAEIADTAEPFIASDLIKEHFGVE
jgi:hypothetical protein